MTLIAFAVLIFLVLGLAAKTFGGSIKELFFAYKSLLKTVAFIGIFIAGLFFFPILIGLLLLWSAFSGSRITKSSWNTFHFHTNFDPNSFKQQGFGFDENAPPFKHPGAMSSEEAYRALELPQEASKDEVKRAHKRLMLKHHPDKGGDPKLAAKINQARDALLK